MLLTILKTPDPRFALGGYVKLVYRSGGRSRCGFFHVRNSSLWTLGQCVETNVRTAVSGSNHENSMKRCAAPLNTFGSRLNKVMPAPSNPKNSCSSLRNSALHS